MNLISALEILHRARTDEIVVGTMAAAREWMKISAHPLDVHYMPSSMGQATSLGLGLALARPDRRVVVLNGDGSLLMNLGSLVTITAQAPPNFLLIVVDNGTYEITGAQPTAAASALRKDGQPIDFLEIARACGFETLFEFSDVESWRKRVGEILRTPGPACVVWKVDTIENPTEFRSPSPAAPRIRAFAKALRESS